MSTKTCASCNKVKSLDQFKTVKRNGKYVPYCYCKPCDRILHRNWSNQWNHNNLTKVRKCWAKATKKWQDKNPDKVIAHRAIRVAVKNGTIKKSKVCEVCNLAPATGSHHADYSKPLEVVWICKVCHKEVEGK